MPANFSYVARTTFSNLITDFTKPKQRLPFLRGWLRANYRYFVFRPNIPQISIYDLVQEERPPQFDFSYEYSSMTLPPIELYVLSVLSQQEKPQTIFEFGTYKGDTTLHLAKCNPNSQLTTIDFPLAADGFVHYNEDTDYPVVFKPGESFHGSAEADRITQLYGDTTTFDFSDHYGKYDFIYIDAEHDYKWGISDSRNAFKMLKPGGTIVWDDYALWPGLKQAVEELSTNRPIYHIRDTRLAIMQS